MIKEETIMKEPVIKVNEFRKTYGDFVAVNGISFEVHEGEIFGLLGPNGAGKTSTLECLEGLRTPDGGSMRVAGVDPSREPIKLSSVIGVQLQSGSLPPSITPREAMNLFCAYHNVAPRTDLLERLGMNGKINKQFFQLSTGQQRRLALALAVVHAPRVILLDEPTAGLDVESRVELHALIRELQAKGTTIILATHDMAEAETLADRVAILLGGKIAAIDTPVALTARGGGLTKISVSTEQASLSKSRIEFPFVQKQAASNGYQIYFSDNIGPTVSAIIAHVETQHDTLVDLRVERPSLEDRFLEITTSNGGSK
jgi:ABC-2 type transport system ATP-binding protein